LGLSPVGWAGSSKVERVILVATEYSFAPSRPGRVCLSSALRESRQRAARVHRPRLPEGGGDRQSRGFDSGRHSGSSSNPAKRGISTSCLGRLAGFLSSAPITTGQG